MRPSLNMAGKPHCQIHTSTSEKIGNLETVNICPERIVEIAAVGTLENCTNQVQRELVLETLQQAIHTIYTISWYLKNQVPRLVGTMVYQTCSIRTANVHNMRAISHPLMGITKGRVMNYHGEDVRIAKVLKDIMVCTF